MQFTSTRKNKNQNHYNQQNLPVRSHKVYFNFVMIYFQSCIEPTTDKNRLLSELLFFNGLTKKPIIKPISDSELLSELPFHKSYAEKPSIIKYSIAFKNYAHSFTVEVLNFRDPRIQPNITKPHVKILLKDLLTEIRGFKFQITLKVISCEGIEIGGTKYICHQSISIL